MLSVGLAGFGTGGAVFHAPLITQVAGLRLAAVATRRREEVASALGTEVRVVASPMDLVRDPEIELVVVSTPTGSHFEVTRAALESGKHVVVDKPFTVSVAEADELIGMARRKGVLLTVYQNRRWDGDFRTVRRCVAEGRLGTVYHYEAHFDRFRPEIKGGWRDEAGAGSGILYDLGAHLIDQVLCLFGVPEAVSADVLSQREGAESVDYFHVVMQYGRRRAIVHSSTLVREPGPHFAVHGDGGSFLKYGMDVQEEALKAGGKPGDAGWGVDAPELWGTLVTAAGERCRVPTEPGCYECFYGEMERAIREGGRVPVDPMDSRNGLRVIEAAQESAASGRVVRFS